MSYSLFRDLVNLTEEFEQESDETDLKSFAAWLSAKLTMDDQNPDEPEWVGKANGRTAESVISTLIVQLNRYAKIYSKNALAGSPFTSIDDVIFLLNLLHFGSMTKIKLVEQNILEKSTGIQIINRLISKGYIIETVNVRDKRSKEIFITEEGKTALAEVMGNIRNASRTVVGDLNEKEKLELIRILQKLEAFHVANIRYAKHLN